MSIFRLSLFLALCLNALFSYAQATDIAKTDNKITVSNAWVRATHPGQSVGAAYMTLTSTADATLTRVESDITKSVEIHSMSMQNGVMKMRMLKELNLAGGKPYQLSPGGYHLMLFDLKKPLNAGERVNLTLHFKDQNNVAFQQTVTAPVKSSADESPATDAHEHHH